MNAGYLINPTFLQQYEANFRQKFLETPAFWNQYKVPYAQAQADCSYLYGILVSTCKGFESAILNDTSTTFDGITAWIHFLRNYDNNGCNEVKLNELDNQLKEGFHGGLIAFIDRFQANMSELTSLEPNSCGSSKETDALGYSTKCKPYRLFSTNLQGSSQMGLLPDCFISPIQCLLL